MIRQQFLFNHTQTTLRCHVVVSLLQSLLADMNRI